MESLRKATIVSLQDELAELRQEVEQLKEVDGASPALNNLPTKCQNGHSLLVALRCIDPDCPEHGEIWGTLDGTATYGPMRLAMLHAVQNEYLQTGRIPMAETECNPDSDDGVQTAYLPAEDISTSRGLEESPNMPERKSDSDDDIPTASFPGQQPSEYVDSDDFDGPIVPERFSDPEDEEVTANKKAVEVENGKTSQSPTPEKS